MAASTAHMANASNDGASFRVHVSGHVKTQCELNSAGTFEQFSNDVYRLGTVGRFCNTAYQMTLMHNADTNGGMISFDGQNVALQDTSVLLVADGGPVDRTADVIISGVDLETAQAIAASMQFQISPRGL